MQYVQSKVGLMFKFSEEHRINLSFNNKITLLKYISAKKNKKTLKFPFFLNVKCTIVHAIVKW
jgi:O-phosphoseryl-tRNA(Cys) synthetase